MFCTAKSDETNLLVELSNSASLELGVWKKPPRKLDTPHLTRGLLGLLLVEQNTITTNLRERERDFQIENPRMCEKVTPL
jgi:hypothetical protein